MSYIIKFIYEFLISSLCAVSFGVFFNTPKRSLLPCAFTAGLGWIIYFYFSSMNFPYIFPVFFGTLTVGILSEIFARLCKMPVTIFLIPCIIPLVPGGSIYYMMFYVIQNKKNLVTYYGYETLMSACGIAVAIIISSSIFRIFKFYQQRK